MTARRPRTTGAGVRPAVLRGRSAELGLVLRTLGTVRSGQSAAIVVVGEPGIGKTALVTAVVEQAERLGFRAAHSAARPDDRVTPLASLGPALRFGATPMIDSADFMDLAGLHEQPLWLAERLAVLIEQRAQDSPVLVALDDAQWCDPLTAFSLRVLPKRLLAAPIAWVVATRPVSGGGPAAQFAEAAAPDLPVVTVELAGLSADAVAEVAADRLGTAPADAVVRQLAGVHGNPFLTVQVLDGLFEPGTAEPTASARVPAGLLDGVRRRLAATSPACRELVRTGAVLGTTFPLDDVAGLLGVVSSAELTEPLIEAIDAGLLSDDGTTVRFRHELLREAVYEDQPPSARHSLHRAFADHVLARGRGYAAAAPHVLATATPGDSAAAGVLRKAAHELLGTMATTSVTFIRHAFELTGRDEPAWGEIGAEAVAILGAARQFADATRFADELLAADIPAELHARIRLLLLPRLWATGRYAELGERARRPAGVPELDARLACYRALADGTVVEPGDDPVAGIVATVAEAEAAARGEHRRRAHELFAAARHRAQGVTGYGAPEAGQLAARELVALARIDDIDGALHALDDGSLFASSWQAPQLAVLRAQFALGAGRVDEAVSAVATADDLMTDLHDDAFQPQLSELRATLAVLRGDDAAGGIRLAPADDVPGTLWPEDWLVAAACSAHHRGDQESVLASAAQLAELAARNGDVASIVGAQLLVNALSTGDFAAARNTLRGSQRTLLVTRADEEFGRFALRGGERAAGVAALDSARDRYAELGAVAPALRVQRVLQAAGVRRRRWASVPQRPESGWSALTEMERRVALLVAQGHTNRSAADELVLSPSTISTHLRAVFSKLDVHSRVQLANLVLRNDGV